MLNTNDCVLNYEALSVLAKLVEEKGSHPMKKVDLTGAFSSLEDVDYEVQGEIKMCLVMVLDALKTTRVEELVLKRCELDEHCATELSQSLSEMPELKVLDLHDTTLKEGSLKLIARALQQSQVKLTKLDISKNSDILLCDTASYLANYVSKIDTLIDFDMSEVESADSSAIADICTSLKPSAAHGRLTSLNISNIFCCQSEGVNAIVDLLKVSKSLTYLDISYLNLSKKRQHMAIVEALCESASAKTLTTLKKSDTEVPATVAR